MKSIQDYFYQIGGSLPQNALTYVVRQADWDLYQNLKQSEFCYVLNSRQMGKSSLLVRTMQRLQAEEYCCATIDISDIGNPQVSLEKWYGGVAYKLLSSFNLFHPSEFVAWWKERELIPPVQRLSELIETILLAKISQKTIIFIDEIDSVLSLSEPLDDFFALIRACYNKRAQNSAYQRLTFVLLGVTTPTDLIADPNRTPFNIGKAIELQGFQFAEAQPLMQGLVGKVANPSQTIQEILEWTGGQPFLTQKLCKLVEEWGNERSVVSIVQAKIIENWEAQDEPTHLKTIRDRILKNQRYSNRLLGLYQKILKLGAIPTDDSAEQTQLQLSGLVVRREGQLQVYNRIYQEVFDRTWVEKALFDLRPYGEALAAWLATHSQDSSRLLRGQALEDARNWAIGKSLSNQDYQFLAASAEAELADFRYREESHQAEIQRLNREKLLLEELTREQERRKATEAQLRQERLLRVQYVTGAAGAVMSILAFLVGVMWVRSTNESMNMKINTLCLLSSALLADHQKLEALTTSLQAGKDLKRSFAISPDVRMRAIATLHQTVYHFSEEQNAEVIPDSHLQAKMLAHLQLVRQSSTRVKSPNGQFLAMANPDGTINLTHHYKRQISRTLTGNFSPVTRLQFSPNNKIIAAASADFSVKLWGVKGTLLTLIHHSHRVTSFSFSPDSQTLATSSQGQVFLWHIDGSLLATLPVSQTEIRSISFSPNGQMLAALGADNKVYWVDLDLHHLFQQGCDRLQTYLKTHPKTELKFSHPCKGI